ncbi:ABC-2 type transport system permease protein [Ekhidna lutea]|uniref:ABC-2 type transport system permease protein n=1 Tax=Ekhidna lutea TaxID=447679 RepID=A0A239IVY6_EKHLU|nr:ABC transporter permease [Ekhidna lutea]SNS97729.1 ABC-2 type transport system permease protein [Ekhidna lutea]
MNKIFLVIQREFMSRVKKKSFLLATILVPLLFPAIIGGMVYLAIQNEKNKELEVIHVLDESSLLKFEDTESYDYQLVEGPLDSAKARFSKSDDFALIYVPKIEVDNPEGIKFYAHTSPGVNLVDGFENKIEAQLRDVKLTRSGLTEEQLEELKTYVQIESFNLSETGDEKKSDSGVTFGIGYVMGFLIYIFLFAYGAQVMQGVIEEKNSKIVEVIVSTVRPFHMMIGKVVGVASVGIVQFLIWMVLMSVISFAGMAAFGLSMDPAETAQMMQAADEASSVQSNAKVQEMMSLINDIPITKIVLLFIFFFLGGYLLYGALFAAVGSAVDTPADAQQFMMPIMMPIIVGLMGLFMFVFPDPHGTISFWLSIIPFTSPIVMMGRIGFGVPAWEIALSMVLLVGGFIFTLWLAGRIYRIGILMHGTKVNYKVLAKWLMQKN